MKLGFWNRLSLALGTLFTLIGSTWLVLSENDKMYDTRASGFSACLNAIKPGSNLTYEFCNETWMTPVNSLGLKAWAETAFAFAAFSLVVYIGIWIAVWVAKWVWRGRQVSSDLPE